MSGRSRQRNRRQVQQKKTTENGIYDLFECYSCRQNNRRGQADVFCVECNDYFCSKCKEMHRLIPRLDKHFFTQYQEFVVGVSKDALFQDACQTHPKLYIDIRCDTHDEIVCNLCSKTQHKDCKTEYILNYVKEKDFSGQLQDAQAELVRVTEDLGRQLETRRHMKERLDSRRTHVVDGMVAFKDRIQHMFDELENRTLQEVEQRRENAKNAIQESERAQEPYYEKLEEYEAHAEALKARGLTDGDPEMDELVIKMNHCLGKIDELEPEPFKLDFQVDNNILEMLENASALGTVGFEPVANAEGGAAGGEPKLDVDFKPDLSLLEVIENKLGLGTIRTVTGDDTDADDVTEPENHVANNEDSTEDDAAEDTAGVRPEQTDDYSFTSTPKETGQDNKLGSKSCNNTVCAPGRPNKSDNIDEDSFNDCS